MKPVVYLILSCLYTSPCRADDEPCSSERALMIRLSHQNKSEFTLGVGKTRDIFAPGYEDALEALRECKKTSQRPDICSSQALMAPVVSEQLCIEQSEKHQIDLTNRARHQALAVLKKKLTKDAFESVDCVNVRVIGSRSGYQCVPVADESTASNDKEIGKITADLKRLGLRAVPCSSHAVQWLLKCGPNGLYPDLKECADKKMAPAFHAEESWDSGECASKPQTSP